MDGRWSLCLAGGLLSGLLGCAGRQTVPPQPPEAATPDQPAPAPPPAASKSWNRSTPPTAGQAAPPVAAAPRTSLKPATYVSLGTLKEQAADDPERPLPEREAFRYQARQSYLKAVEVDAKHTAAYVALAKSYAVTNEADKSAAMFQKALKIAPNDASLWFEQGAALARAKDWGPAVDSMTRATQLDAENKQYVKYLGLTLARAGRYDEALAALTQAGMKEAEARTTIARMLKHNQQPEAAEQQAKLALQADPGYEPARQLLAGGAPPAPAAEIDPGVRTVRHEEPAAAPAAQPARPITPPRLPPVLLRGADGLAPAGPIRAGIGDIE